MCVNKNNVCTCVCTCIKHENVKKGIGVYSSSNGRLQAVAGEVSGGSEETTQPERDTWSQRWDPHCLGWAPCTKVTVCSLPHCWQEFWEFITHLVQHSTPSATTHSACVVSRMVSMSTGPGWVLMWSVEGHPHNISFGYNALPTLNLLGVTQSNFHIVPPKWYMDNLEKLLRAVIFIYAARLASQFQIR